VTFAALWALGGLAALPAIVLLHRRRRRPAPVVVPSLLFLEGEPAAPEAPERVRLDLDLLLALAAAALLALAAAGPRVALGAREVVVRVVLHDGPWGGVRRADRLLAQDADDEGVRIRDLAEAAGARVEFAHVRGDDARALEAVREGAASLRVWIRNRPLASEPPDVRTVLVASPAARNVGLVAAGLEPAGPSLRAFATAWNDGPRTEEVRVTLLGPGAEGRTVLVREAAVAVAAGAARSVVFDGVPAFPTLSLGARTSPPDDHSADDSVSFSRLPLVAGVSRAVPEAHGRAVLEGLRAVSGEAAVVRDDARADLWVGPPEDAPPTAMLFLRLLPVGDGPGLRPPPGAPIDLGPAWVTQDLDPAGCDLVYASDPGPPYPIVRAAASPRGSAYEFVPDPLAGSPAPVDHPLWPLFLENLLAHHRGRATAAGYRRQALVDPLGLASSRLGRESRPFDPAWLEGLPPVGAAGEVALRRGLAVLGVLALLALWRPRRRGSLAPARSG
jgi:hypothetical protein